MVSRMKTAIVIGSSRDGAESLRVGQYLESRIKDLFEKSEIFLLDLNKVQIPLDPDESAKDWGKHQQHLDSADSFMLITPEWHGMAAPAIKNFLLHAGRLIAHKPTLIVSVSSGRGGAFPIAELRSSGYKNRRPLYIPDHLIIRKVNDVLHGHKPAGKDDKYIRERIDYSLGVLQVYESAMIKVRQSAAIDLDKYPHGMS